MQISVMQSSQHPDGAAKVITYLFRDNSLVVDQQLRLPCLPAHPDNIVIINAAAVNASNDNSSEKASTSICDVVARDLSLDEAIPEGYQLVPVRQLVSQWTPTQFEQTSRALQLLEWKRSHLFCSRCGNQTSLHTTEYCMKCETCGYSQYPRIQPCVIVAISKGSQILLARSVRRFSKMYGLIAGFVEVGETLENAVARETLEEVGIELKNIQYMASQPWPFPSNLMLAFKADYASGSLVLQEDEIAEADFFDLKDLPTIPPKGSIAYWMIEQLATEHNIELTQV